MIIAEAKSIVMDKACIYDSDTMNTLWYGMLWDVPEQYYNLEIKIIGAKRKGIVELGVYNPLHDNTKISEND